MKKINITLILLLFFNLLFGQNPILWGTTEQGGANNKGTIFHINGDGTNFGTVYSFIDSSGSNPRCTLLQGTNGKLYGTTYNGGFNSGVIFSFDISTGTYNNLHAFNWTSGASRPGRGLIQYTNGLMYGVAQGGGGSDGKIFSFNPANNTYTTVFNFLGPLGGDPFGKLIHSTTGKLYGMTIGKGINNVGVIFSFNPVNNSYSKLFDFDSTSSGRNPWGSIVEANNGKLYGMTWRGGVNNKGVLFSLDTINNSYSVVFNFDSINGEFPVGNLMKANNGKIYGMATNGGSYNYGTLYSFDPNNNAFTLLFNFDYLNGAMPLGGLIQASNGKLYGMTAYGGNYSWGTVFSYDIASNVLLKIHDFDGTNGAVPWEELVEIIPTGIHEQFDKQYQYSIYPNPTNKSLNFFLKNLEIIIITDVFGKIILQKWTKGNVELDVSFLSSGIYFIRVGNEVNKFVKE